MTFQPVCLPTWSSLDDGSVHLLDHGRGRGTGPRGSRDGRRPILPKRARRREDFHARYLLTDKGGIRVDAGFEPVGEHQNMDVNLMDFDLSQMRLASVACDARKYELVEPVLRISANGEVDHV